MPKTYSELYIAARRALRGAGVEAYGLEARLIVAHAAGKTAEKLVQSMNLYTSDDVERRTGEYLARRLAGEPTAYITGEWEFYGLPMLVTRDTLIPRADTEVLVDTALALLRGRKNDARILDLCCGSGCIGCALAKELPLSRVVMADISSAALAVARQNAERNGLAVRTAFAEADAMQPPPMYLGSFDMIVCNPPYIETAEIETLDESVRLYEPHAALDGGADGLVFYRAVLNRWRGSLRLASELVFEIGETQAEDVIRLMRLAGLKGVECVKDTAGHDRVVYGRI